MTPEEFRKAGHALIDWIADYRQRIPELPVRAQVQPGEVRAALPVAPAGADHFSALLADLDRVIVPGVTQVQHPMHFGWFPPTPRWRRCWVISPAPAWAPWAFPGRAAHPSPSWRK